MGPVPKLTPALTFLEQTPIADGARAVGLGHGVYFEFEEGEEKTPVLPWIRGLREAFTESGFATAAVLTYGSRWVVEPDGSPAFCRKWSSRRCST